MTLIIDCNNFFYKSLMWVKPEHGLLSFRITLWGFHAVATSKEWYEFITNPMCNRLGPFAWLAWYTTFIELSGWIKFSKGEFTEPLPTWAYIFWSSLLVVWLLGLMKSIANDGKYDSDKEIGMGKKYDPYNPPVEIENKKTK